MGSEAALRLPLIDFTKQELRPGSHEWDSVRAQVREALERFGGFEANYEKIPEHILKEVLGAMEGFFDLPLETKKRSAARKGYVGYVEAPPPSLNIESLGIEDATMLDKVENVAKVTWPEGNSRFSETVASYANKLAEFEQTIRKIIIESLGIENYMKEQMDFTKYLVRFIKYIPPMTTEAKENLIPHTDKNFVTILYQNEVQGLKLQTKDGDWINYKPASPNSFLVIIGDTYYAWTNGRLHCPQHKVVMSGNDVRYSIGLFSTPKVGYIIKAPDELVDENHPRLFKPFEHHKFIEFLYSNAPALDTSRSHLEVYCSISNEP